MTAKRFAARQIEGFILDQMEKSPDEIARVVRERFDLSRQTVSKHLNALVRRGLLTAEGNARARRYQVKALVDEVFAIPVEPGLEEDVVWRNRILPLVGSVPENVLTICNHGFVEMLNNVVSHSEGSRVIVTFRRSAASITFAVQDDGVGIFQKIARDLHLNDPRHALLELVKGKLTTDPRQHTGEGIFFTSRMFDDFSILSGTLFYGRTRADEDDWLIETEDRLNSPGTRVSMSIKLNSTLTVQRVFEQFVSGKDDDVFARTHVPIMLAKYDRDQLISRSAARRVLVRFERFREVMLDFQGVEVIGQAFADEIFRVFARAHPEIRLYVLNASAEVQSMISHAEANKLAVT